MNTRIKQEGAALITALVCLIMVSMMGVIAMRTAGTNAKIAANAKQANQAMRMTETTLTSFFINPAAVWDLETVQGTISNFTPIQVGNASVPVQAEYTNDAVCSIKKGVDISSGQDSTASSCIYFRVASNYQATPMVEATSSAGFFVEVGR